MAEVQLVELLRSANIPVFNQVVTALIAGPNVIVDLTGADLTRLDLSEAAFWRCDLSGANLCQSRVRALVLAGARISDTVLEGVTFVDDPRPVTEVRLLWRDDPAAWNEHRAKQGFTVMSGCNFDGRVFGAVNLAQMSMTTCRFVGADLTACTGLDHLKLVGARLDGANLRGVRAFALDLQRAVLDGAHLDSVVLDSAQFTQGSARAICCVGATLKSTLASRWRAPGAVFDGASLSDVHLADAVLTDASFRNASLSNCLLVDADLRGCVFENTTFVRCSFAGADVAGARFERCHGLDLTAAVNRQSATVRPP